MRTLFVYQSAESGGRQHCKCIMVSRALALFRDNNPEVVERAYSAATGNPLAYQYYVPQSTAESPPEGIEAMSRDDTTDYEPGPHASIQQRRSQPWCHIIIVAPSERLSPPCFLLREPEFHTPVLVRVRLRELATMVENPDLLHYVRKQRRLGDKYDAWFILPEPSATLPYPRRIWLPGEAESADRCVECVYRLHDDGQHADVFLLDSQAIGDRAFDLVRRVITQSGEMLEQQIARCVDPVPMEAASVIE